MHGPLTRFKEIKHNYYTQSILKLDTKNRSQAIRQQLSDKFLSYYLKKILEL